MAWREARGRWCRILAAVAAITFTSAPASGRGVSVSTDLTFATRYVDKELSVYTPGPVFQPDVTITHESTGCFGTVWLSAGLAQSGGDEIDFTLGCARSVSADVKLNGSVAEYVFRDGSWTVLSAGLTRHAISLQGYFYLPKGFGQPGARLVGSYSRSWRADSLIASLVRDTGGENAVRPLTAFLVQDEHALSKCLHLIATAQLPLIRRSGDLRRAQLWAALIFKF